MDAKLELPPIRLCGQAFLFAWRMCLFFSPVVLVFSSDPARFLLPGRFVFLIACAAGLVTLVLLRRTSCVVGSQRAMILLGSVCAAGGSALAVFGSSAGVSNLAVALCGYAVAGFGDSLLALSFGFLYGELSVKLSMRVVPLATVFAAVLYAVLVNAPSIVSVPLVVALPMVCAAVLLYDSSRGDQAPSPSPAPEANVPTADTFTKWKISLYTAVLWFSFGVMWVLAAARLFDNARLFSSFSLSVSALVVIAALVVAGLTYVLKLPTAKTFWIFVPLTIAGISVVAVVDSNVQVFAFAMVFAARSIAEMQLITHFAAICRRRGQRPVLLFGCGFAILSVGEALGLLVGSFVLSIESTGLTMLLLVCANVIVIAVILSIMRVNATFQKAELEAFALSQAELAQPREFTADQTAQAWAQRYGLSAREEEVAALLLLGRNVPAIAEMLCISQSTVHTHVKHIYEKTGVHTRQELMDLRDGSREG